MNTMRKLIIPLVLFALVLGSCEDELTSLNENPKQPSEVPGETLFSNAQVSLGNYLTSSDINSNIFKLISQYWASTTYATESQYELTTRSIPSNLWEELYTDVLKDLDEADRLIEENQFIDEQVKQNQKAAIEVLQVLTFYELVNIFGDIPYSDALVAENTQPTYDAQTAIYSDLLTRLNTAIGNFNPSAGSFGSADVFYNGDVESWVRFANSLKMRIGITLAEADGELATAGQTAVEEASPNAFTSNADNAVIPFQSAPPWTNPIWEDLVQSGRNDYVPANTIVDMMNAVDDPRRPILFTQLEGEYVGGVYGTTNEYENFSHFCCENEFIKSPDFEGMILEYAEVEFIRAEAIERGWNVSGTAAGHYENAIRADMSYWGVEEQAIDAYLLQTDVAYATAPGDFEEKIGTQKWMAFYLQGIQGWTEWRRLDYPILNVPPEPQGLTYQDIPSRFTYPVDEQNLNQDNYEAAAQAIGGDELTTQLFWDADPPTAN